MKIGSIVSELSISNKVIREYKYIKYNRYPELAILRLNLYQKLLIETLVQ